MSKDLSYENIINDLKNKNYAPIYFLMGDEPYYIDKISDFAENNILDEAEKGFNQTILYGNDIDALTIVDNAKRYPMMSEYQVVIIKEAQHVKNIELIENYVKNPLSSTVLIICYKYKKLDARKTLPKTIAKNGVLFESKKMYENQVAEWVTKLLKSKGIISNPVSATLLTEYLGNDLQKIENELEKLTNNIKKGEELTPQLIEKYVGISKDYNDFELNNAIAEKNILKANKIIQYFAKNPKNHPLVLTLSTIFSYFSKLLAYHFLQDKSKENVASVLKINPFFVKDYQLAAKHYNPKKTVEIIAYLREYDLKSKGVNSNGIADGELLKELIYKILH
jgi:DNA polymerase III subunit delta